MLETANVVYTDVPEMSELPTIVEEVTSPPEKRATADEVTPDAPIRTKTKPVGSGHKYTLREAMVDLKRQSADEMAQMKTLFESSAASSSRLADTLADYMQWQMRM